MRSRSGRNSIVDDETEWLSEETIPDDKCNLIKTEDGYLDDNEYSEPYRHISNWFFTTKTDTADGNRVALPENMKRSLNNLCLYGSLESNSEPGKLLYKVKITYLKSWSFDRHFWDRGIWILSRSAWYKLKKPCTKLITLPDGTETSQEKLFLPLRAKCGLVSNLLDMMSNSIGVLQLVHLSYHAHKLPQESYSELVADRMESKDSTICKDPFDISLLKRDPVFVKTQLRGVDKVLSNACLFMKGLTEMSKSLTQAKKAKESWAMEDIDYRKSAEIAEDRSNRYPWGCQKLNSDGKWVSKLTKLVLVKMTDMPTIGMPPQTMVNKAKPIAQSHGNTDNPTQVDLSNAVNVSDISECSYSENSRHKEKRKLNKKIPKKMHNEEKQPLRGPAERELNIVSPSECFENVEKETATKNIKMYVDRETNGIHPSKLHEFVKEVINSDDIFSFEHMFVHVQFLINSSDNAKKLLFYSKDMAECGSRTIFIRWLRKSMQMIKNRSIIDKQKNEKSNKRKAEDLVAEKIIELFLSFGFLTAKNLATIEERIELSFNSCINEVHDFAIDHRKKNLINACMSAKSFLNDIKFCSNKKRKAPAMPPPKRKAPQHSKPHPKRESMKIQTKPENKDLLGNLLQNKNMDHANKNTPDYLLKRIEKQKRREAKTNKLDEKDEIQKLKDENQKLKAQLEQKSTIIQEKKPKPPSALVPKEKRFRKSVSFESPFLNSIKKQTERNSQYRRKSYTDQIDKRSNNSEFKVGTKASTTKDFYSIKQFSASKQSTPNVKRSISDQTNEISNHKKHLNSTNHYTSRHLDTTSATKIPINRDNNQNSGWGAKTSKWQNSSLPQNDVPAQKSGWGVPSSSHDSGIAKGREASNGHSVPKNSFGETDGKEKVKEKKGWESSSIDKEWKQRSEGWDQNVSSSKYSTEPNGFTRNNKRVRRESITKKTSSSRLPSDSLGNWTENQSRVPSLSKETLSEKWSRNTGMSSFPNQKGEENSPDHLERKRRGFHNTDNGNFKRDALNESGSKSSWKHNEIQQKSNKSRSQASNVVESNYKLFSDTDTDESSTEDKTSSPSKIL